MSIIQFPCAERLDARDALLKGQSTPQARRPRALDAAIDARARALAEQAYELCREHLRRRIAYNAERGYAKRVIDMAEALRVIKQGDLGDALVHVYSMKLRHVIRSAHSAARVSQQFLDVAQEVHAVVDYNPGIDD